MKYKGYGRNRTYFEVKHLEEIWKSTNSFDGALKKKRTIQAGS
jgi:hypothetical protein